MPREFTAENIEPLVRGFTYPDDFDLELEPEEQTDKALVKVVPCRECKRALAVTTFFAPAKALCTTCKLGGDHAAPVIAKPKPGDTNPARALNLKDCLINPSAFAEVFCPFDPEHSMEIKSVTHSQHYGPTKLLGYDNKGIPRYEIETGETVMHQCKECHTTLTLSTQHPVQYKTQNAPREASSAAPSWVYLLGPANEQPHLTTVHKDTRPEPGSIALVGDAAKAVFAVLNQPGIPTAAEPVLEALRAKMMADHPDYGDISEDQTPDEIAEQVEAADAEVES